MKYKAFISYRHAVSKEFAENLELALKAYAKPLWRPPIAIFRDEKYLKAGLDLPKMIMDALDQSEFLIYIASPEAADSPWVQDELTHWCSKPSCIERLIIILTAGTIELEQSRKGIDWDKTNAIPRLLRPFLGGVPLYLDASQLGVSARQTLLDPDFKKLVNSTTASLRGTDPIEMSGQEIMQHRKNMRSRNLLLSAALTAIILAAAGGGIAYQQQRNANRQRTIATARLLAAQSQATLQKPYQIDKAVLLAAESMKRWPSADADQMLREGIALFPHPVADIRQKSNLTTVALSPDAHGLVVPTDDKKVHIWELVSGSSGGQPAREVSTIDEEGVVLGAAISPNGKYLLTGDTRGEARIFDFPSGRSLLGRMQTDAQITDILVTPDSRYFITRSSSPTVYVGQLPDGRKIGPLQHKERVMSLSLSRDGSRLCTGTEKGDVSLWDWRAQRLLFHSEGAGPISSVACRSDGLLVAADSTGRVRVTSLKGVLLDPVRPERPVHLVALNADGSLLATASDAKIQVWDTNCWNKVAEMALSGRLTFLVFHPQGRFLATAGLDYAARLWDLASGREILRVPHQDVIVGLSFDRDGRYLATASADNSVRVAPVRLEDMPLPREEPRTTAVAYNSRGNYFATGDQYGLVQVWSVESPQPSMQVQLQDRKEIYRLAFSPDGHFLAVADLLGGVGVIDVNSQAETVGIRRVAKARGIGFSPDGQYLAFGGSDHQVQVCTAALSNCRTLAQADDVNGLAFSPDSRRLAVTTGSFGQVHHNGFAVWDLQSRRATLEIKDQPDPFEGTSFSEDGRYIVTGEQDFAARIWDSSAGREVTLPLSHDSTVWSAAFSSDGKYLVTGSEDHSLRVWEWSSQRELVRLTQPGAVRLAAFGQKDRNIIAASFDPSGHLRQFRVWKWKPDELIAEACSKVGHGLSEEDWRLFIGPEKYEPICGKSAPMRASTR